MEHILRIVASAVHFRLMSHTFKRIVYRPVKRLNTFFTRRIYQKSGEPCANTRHLFASYGVEYYRHSFPTVKANTQHLF